MASNDKNIGVAIIELHQTFNNGDYNWGQIQYTPQRVLVGMYEDGHVERQLFYMDKAQAIADKFKDFDNADEVK